MSADVKEPAAAAPPAAAVIITNQADAIAAAQQQYQLQDQSADNVDDTRFVLPTDQPNLAAQQQQQQGSSIASVATGAAAAGATIAKVGNELAYQQEVSFVNTSTSEGFTIPNEEKDLETRLKYVHLIMFNQMFRK